MLDYLAFYCLSQWNNVFLFRDANIILSVLIAVSTLTVHTLSSVTHCKTEHLNDKWVTDVFQNTKKTAVYSEWVTLQQPAALLIILNTGRLHMMQKR